jgi:small GTP-binding protein
MALIEQGDTAAPENCQRLVILGSSKVGKTSIVSRFLCNKFDESYTPTIEDFHRKIYRIKGEAYRLDILDTSGNHPFPAMRRLSIITGKEHKLQNKVYTLLRSSSNTPLLL